MTDLLERRLADRLRSRPLPDGVPDLAGRSMDRGRRIRRRRVGGLVLALALLLVVPGLAWTVARPSATAPDPAAPPSEVAGGPDAPVRVTLDPELLPPGPDPSLSTVRGDRIQTPAGRRMTLPEDQAGSVAEFWGGYAWLTGRGRDLRLSSSPERLPLPAGAAEAVGAEPGPGGSVMVRTDAGPVLLTRDSAFVVPRDPVLRTAGMVASARALWVERAGRVVRVDAPDPRLGFVVAADYPQWQKVVVGDPQSDRVVLVDQDRCAVVVSGSSASPLWTGCGWELGAFSPDGRFVGGRHPDGSYGVVDLRTGRWTLAVGVTGEPVRLRPAVDDEGRLSLVTGTRADGFRLVTCDQAGRCTVSAVGTPGRLDFVLPNRQ